MSKPSLAGFAAVMKKTRLAKKLSQEQFGVMIGLHRTHVSLFERQMRDPKLSTLHQIASNLGMSLAQFHSLIDEEIAAQAANFKQAGSP